MSNREEVITNTRNYVFAVCALLGGADYLLYDKTHEYPLVRLAVVAFSIAIFIGVVHIGILYWEELYGENKPEWKVEFLTFTVRGKFSLMLFIFLVATGLALLLLHVLSA